MGEDFPSLYGVRMTNMSPEGLWSRELFPKAFSVALCNRLGDGGGCLNSVRMDSDCRTKVRCVRLPEVYGTDESPTELTFGFDTVYPPFLDLAHGVPESDLVIGSPEHGFTGRFDMQASVIPDASTKGLSSELMGPEMTVRTPTLKNLALSFSSSLVPFREEALSVLSEGISEGLRWDDWHSVSPYVTEILDSLGALERRFCGLQRPFLIQSLWKSEDGGPFMADDAMDVFVWTDLALSRLFLDSTRRASDGSATRPVRSAVRLHRMLSCVLVGNMPDLDRIVSSTGYGLPSGGREFMVNGRTTNRYMACERLSRPAFASSEVPTLASEGFESMIVPERRLDMSVYYAVRAVRG